MDLSSHRQVVHSPGMDDNGSGSSALVEAARILSSADCVFEHSIIFVGFDLEEVGESGYHTVLLFKFIESPWNVLNKLW